MIALAPGDGRDLAHGFGADDRIDLGAFEGEFAVAISGTAAGVTVSLGAASVTLAGLGLAGFDTDQLLF